MMTKVRPVNACINFNRDMSWGYIEGTKTAAELIADHMLRTERDLDTLIYPLGYLYRHHIELQLKWLIERANWLSDSAECAPKTHRISTLWEQLHRSLLVLYPAMKDDLQEIANLIQPLWELDNSGEEFRYPKNRNGGQTLGRMGRIIDVGEFVAGFNTVAQKLDVLHFGLDIEWDRKCEAFELHEQSVKEQGHQLLGAQSQPLKT